MDSENITSLLSLPHPNVLDVLCGALGLPPRPIRIRRHGSARGSQYHFACVLNEGDTYIEWYCPVSCARAKRSNSDQVSRRGNNIFDDVFLGALLNEFKSTQNLCYP
jgi:hypothetical protein